MQKKEWRKKEIGGNTTSSFFHVARSIILTGLVCIFTDKIFNFIIVNSYKKRIQSVWT